MADRFSAKIFECSPDKVSCWAMPFLCKSKSWNPFRKFLMSDYSKRLMQLAKIRFMSRQPGGREKPLYGASLWGELLSTACNFKGVAGSVADGPSRDLTRCRAIGFKIFGTGSSPVDINGRYEVVGHNVPGCIDGILIRPGDLIVGDVDGVTVVPTEAVEEVIKRVIEKSSGESNFRKAVKAGMAPSAAFEKFGVL